MRLLDKIAEDFCVPNVMLEETMKSSRKLVKHIKIPKKDGSFRTVVQPSRKLKLIQYWLITNVFEKMNIHNTATAYRKSISIKDNANAHRNHRYFLKLDFKDFFPSIKFTDFLPYIVAWHGEKNPSWVLDGNSEKFIRFSCFYLKNRLPIGYPSSPIISNIVMYEFDELVTSEFSNNIENYGNVKFTRYADDLIFSTNKKGACKKIYQFINSFLKEHNSPRLKLNRQKTRYVSSSGGSALVTGLRVCYDGHITIHKRYKDRVRLLITLYAKGHLRKEEEPKLRGHLSYIKDVDPAFYTKLQNKYLSVIRRLLNDSV